MSVYGLTCSVLVNRNCTKYGLDINSNTCTTKTMLINNEIEKVEHHSRWKGHRTSNDFLLLVSYNNILITYDSRSKLI